MSGTESAAAGMTPAAQLIRKDFDDMLRLLLHWILNAAALLIVSRFVPGFEVAGVGVALVAVVVIGLLNATLGLLLKILTLPLGILTLGLFFLVINAIILKMSSGLVPGFYVHTFGAAFVGALALALLHMLFAMFWKRPRREVVREV